MSRGEKCPTCSAAVTRTTHKLFPFCTQRCQMIDLGRWFGEEYRVPGEPADPEAVARELIARGGGDGGSDGNSGDSGDSH